MKFTLLARERSHFLVDRYSEYKERAPMDWNTISADLNIEKSGN